MVSTRIEGGGLIFSLLLFCLLLWAAQGQDQARKPPEIKNPSVASEIFMRVGDSEELHCEATGKPDPIYEWYWNGAIIDTTDSDNITYDASSGLLSVTDLTVQKEGFFYCRAENTIGNDGLKAVAISPKIEIRVGRIGSWITDDTVHEVSAKLGSYVQIPCDTNLPVYYGPTNFEWYTTDGTKQEKLTLTDRQFLDGKGTLHFAYMLASDTLDGKNYACAMSNAKEGNIRLGREVQLNLEGGGTLATDRPPQLEYPPTSPTTVTFERKKNAHMECFFSGFAETDNIMKIPEVTWWDGTDQLKSGGRITISNEGRVLVISSLLESDEKTYTCNGTLNNQSQTGNIFLNVTSAPIWTRSLSSMTAIQGENATLFCETRAASSENPPERPRWYKNGDEFDPADDSTKYQFLDDRRELVVKTVQKDKDIACYQCYVSNSVNEVFSDGCMNVILPITIETRPEAVQEVTEGDIVNLTVVATTDSLMTLTYRWLFKNETYEGSDAPPFVQYDPTTKEAFINTSGLSDSEFESIAGVYSREMYHQYQKKFVNVTVKVPEPPVVVPVAEAGFDYWIIGLILGILLIIIVILIICCVICRRKMLEGDYPVDRKETAAGLDPEKELKDSGFHDLSRADYDYPQEKKPLQTMDFDEVPMGDDESFGSAEYGDEATAFNEDGSFIGIYKDKKGGPPGYQSESNV